MRKGRLPEGWEVHHKVLTNFQNTFSRDMAPGEVVKVDFPIQDGDIYPKKH